ncbi:MAG TPA: hypothetical protein VK658_26595 [Chryseolinea sp.]|nr:hypothetical protein [Chryseolinea sp.]
MKTPKRKSSKPVAGKPGRKSDKAKRWLADVLQKQSERLSPTQKRTALVGIAVIIAMISVAVIAYPFRNGSLDSSALLPMKIHAPSLTAPVPDNVFSEEDFLLLTRFKKTLDSLKRYDPQVYNDILKGRDGLLDSVTYLIGLYTLQPKP